MGAPVLAASGSVRVLGVPSAVAGEGQGGGGAANSALTVYRMHLSARNFATFCKCRIRREQQTTTLRSAAAPSLSFPRRRRVTHRWHVPRFWWVTARCRVQDESACA